VIPTSHAAIGARLASRLQLPPGLIEAIRWHHDRQFESQNAEVALIIHLANIIVNSYNEDPDCVINFTELHPDARKLMMGALKNVSDFYSSIAEEIEAAYAFFLPSRA
jgi:HD-like signal output (HDOD) protein